MIGWIKLHRKIRSHWIYENPEYLKWWVDILMEANFEPKKVLIKNMLLECKRGEVLYSYVTWAKRWKTTRSKAMRFLKMLEKDSMIVLKSVTVTTRLTICNYDSYQDVRTADEPQVNRKRTASELQVNTTKERKKEKNDKEEAEISVFSVQDAKEIFDSSGLQGNLFAKICKAYSISKEQVLPIFEKWKALKEGEVFQDEKHLRNSFTHFVKIENPVNDPKKKIHIRSEWEEEFEKNNWW